MWMERGFESLIDRELPGKLKLKGYLGRLLDRQVSGKVEDKDGRRKGLMDKEMEGKLEIQVGLHVNVSAGLLLMYLQPTGKLVKIEGVDLFACPEHHPLTRSILLCLTETTQMTLHLHIHFGTLTQMRGVEDPEVNQGDLSEN